jgi:hypothetical protein
MKGSERSSDGAGEGGKGREVPVSQILDMPLTAYSVHRTADAAVVTNAEQCSSCRLPNRRPRP